MTSTIGVDCRFRSSASPSHEFDAVTRSLRLGDFQIVVAGDGIRSDTHAIA